MKQFVALSAPTISKKTHPKMPLVKAESAPIQLPPESMKAEKPFVANAAFVEVSALPVDNVAPSADTNRNVRSAVDAGVNILVVKNTDGTFSCGVCHEKNFDKMGVALLHQRMFHSTSADAAFRRGKVGRHTLNALAKLKALPFDQCDLVVSLVVASVSFSFSCLGPRRFGLAR